MRLRWKYTELGSLKYYCCHVYRLTFIIRVDTPLLSFTDSDGDNFMLSQDPTEFMSRIASTISKYGKLC